MIEFYATPIGGLQITDTLENTEFTLRTDNALSPKPVETDTFPFSVETAVSITTDSIRFPQEFDLTITDGTGSPANIEHPVQSQTLPKGDYFIRIPASSTTYLGVSQTTLSIERPELEEFGFTTLSFNSFSEVLVGIRSTSDLPEGEITTTGTPENLMEAISYLGASHKEFS